METTLRVIPTTTFMNLGVIDGVHTFGTDLSALFGPGADALWDGNAPFLLESARTGRRIPMVPCDHKRNDEGEVLSRGWLGALPGGGTVWVVIFND